MADGSIIAQPGMISPIGPMPLMAPLQTRATDPKKEYLAGGWRASWNAGGFSTLAAHADEANLLFGPRLWELMDTEPTVSATLTTLAAAIVSEGVQFYPALSDDPDDAGITEADLELAEEITAYCDRIASDPRLRFQDVMYRWVRGALKYGVKLIEVTHELATDGPDKGRLVPRSLKIKPNWSWSFVIDVWGNLRGIVGAVPRPEDGQLATTSLAEVLPPEKFLILSFNQEDDDPRGHSACRSAYTAWDEKVKLPKERWKFLQKFGTPTWVGTTSEEAQDVPVLDSNGNDTGKTQTAQQAMLAGLQALENATAIAVPFGADVQCVEPRSDGSAFRLAADDDRREIVFAILCQVRATLESQHGSKADSETSQDILDTVVMSGRHWAESVIKLGVSHWVELNWGPEVARRLTPRVTLGKTTHQNLTLFMRAIADGWSKGLFFESMRRPILSDFGYRVPRNPGPPSGPVLPAGSGLGDPESEPAKSSPAGPTP